MLRHALPASAILAAFGLGATWGMGSLLMRPHPSAVAPAVPPAQDFSLTASDGLAIAATFWPGRDAGAPGVLLLHGNGASRQAMAGNAGWLNAQGFAVLAIDFRGHGQSAPATRSFGLHEARDAAAAFAWLKRRQGGAPTAVVGISLGDAASLLGEDGPLPADALVLQAVYPDIRHAIRNRIASRSFDVVGWLAEPLLSLQAWPRLGVRPQTLAPIRALPRFAGPVLMIGGEMDRSTPPAETALMYSAVTGPRSLWMAPGADHEATAGLETEAYRTVLLAFLRRTIGAPRR